MKRRAVSLAVLVLWWLMGHGQVLSVDAATIVGGRIVDGEGRPVPQAKVMLSPPGRGSARTTESDHAGVYRFEPLSPGEYALTVEAEGIAQARRTVRCDGAGETGVLVEDIALAAAIPRLDESVVVRADALTTYREEMATTGTKIAAALRDIPQSVQVVSRQVIDDQSAIRTHEVVQNVSGVYRGNTSFGDTFLFRGFEAGGFAGGLLRDGYPDRRESVHDSSNVERVEVLKGPASVLYGRLHPGGTINYVTKQPPFAPWFVAELKADSEGLVRPTFDLSSVGANGKLGLRVKGSLEQGGTFRDFSFSNRKFIAAVLAWRPFQDTQLWLECESLDDRRLFDRGIPPLGDGPAAVPVTRFVGEPSDYRRVAETLYGYTLEHQFSPAWKVKHALRTYGFVNDDARTQMRTLDAATGHLTRDFRSAQRDQNQLTAQLELTGDIRLVGMRHQLLFGLDMDRFSNDNQFFIGATATTPGINIFRLFAESCG